MTELNFFTDRSLGDVIVPTALREAGWNVVSMVERYGQLTAEALADIHWIPEATERGEILLTGDKMIARRPLEAAAVARAGARVFALSNGQIRGADKAARYLRWQKAIFRRALSETAPYVVGVTGHGLERLTLHD